MEAKNKKSNKPAGDLETSYNQHRKLLKLLEELIAGEGKSEPDEYARVHSELTDYFIKHFDTELAFMKELDFPGKEHHVSEHNDFLYTISLLKWDSKMDVSVRAEQLFSVVNNWLVSHELGKDIDYIEYVVKNIKKS